jgi:hypothetical protein
MQRRARRALTILLLMMLLVGAALAALMASSDTLLRHAVERMLQVRLTPIVTVSGPVEWRLRPAPMLAVRGLRLSDDDGASLLHIDEISIHIDADGIAARRLAIAALDIRGMELNLRLGEGARLDAQRWLREEAASPDAAPATMPPVGAISIDDGRVRVGTEGGVYVADELRLRAGPIGPDVPAKLTLGGRVRAPGPERRDASLDFSARARFDDSELVLEDAQLWVSGRLGDRVIDDGRIGADRMRLAFSGRVHADAPWMHLGVTGPDGRVDVRGSANAFEGSGVEWTADDLHVEVVAGISGAAASVRVAAGEASLNPDAWRMPDARLDAMLVGVNTSVDVTLSGAFEWTLGEAGRALSAVVTSGAATLPHPSGSGAPLVVAFSGSAMLDPVSERATVAVSGSFDDSEFDGRGTFDASTLPPLSVVLDLDRLDLDRYLPPKSHDEAATDLAVWRTWPVNAELRVGELQFQGFVSRDARLSFSGSR